MMPDRFPSKPITLGGHAFNLRGISAEDTYWSTLHNGFEPEFARFCEQLIAPDYVCIDVGANIGVKTLALSRHCPHGQVVGVEAGATVAECLAVNIAANGASGNARAIHAAVSDHIGTVQFEEFSAWGHASPNGAPVEAITLDEVVRRCHLPRVDFIKIDVEGFELPILKSSLNLINRFEALVFVEFNSLTLLVWGNTNPREFIEWITANFRHVYVLNRFDPQGELLTPVISTDQCRAILHRNLIDEHCVTDLVMSNAEHRLAPTSAFMRRQLTASLERQTTLANELAQARADLARRDASGHV